MSNSTYADLGSFAEAIGGDGAVDALRRASETSLASSSQYWRVPMEGRHLTPRMKELLLLAMHGAATALNERAIARHVARARSAGASDADIIDVFVTISGLTVHALYFSAPILIEELEEAGITPVMEPESAIEYEKTKAEFIAARGFWNPARDALVRVMPTYFATLAAQSSESWTNGSLTMKEREFLCIAIDSTVTHNFESGLRLHIRNALKHGATGGELAEILELTALMGLEGLVIGAHEIARDNI
ncbi:MULTISPECIES: carboxymuconolactone decarboxylase family protein [unclassified Microbacterium]|uniref:carboxymuconolactone decarboxylase family protein n=1 Tax=unclassified Microbacterium TaxID=2609290 RepID=UPI00214CF39D|nr:MULTISPECIES: carboxymuconolactone decarboxylase family protein [unclassified Microbacterium]MCR2811387.1 carboxymuconolactone decarboxylase family protein [Microbacterium sp. zg.B185]WIM19567.1 carboxymuconolactone decarboxylase family protein [Microbacterium sp. zg-B185]